MSGYAIISKIPEGYAMDGTSEFYGKNTSFNGIDYHYFYREFQGLKQGFYIQDGIDEIKATDAWYKALGPYC